MSLRQRQTTERRVGIPTKKRLSVSHIVYTPHSVVVLRSPSVSKGEKRDFAVKSVKFPCKCGGGGLQLERRARYINILLITVVKFDLVIVRISLLYASFTVCQQSLGCAFDVSFASRTVVQTRRFERRERVKRICLNADDQKKKNRLRGKKSIAFFFS